MKWGSNTWVGGGLVALAIGVAIFAPWIALTDPVMDANLMNAELPPSWEFPFGTDAQGRDIYSRICYGARVSLTVGVVSQICNSLIGVTLGLTAGFWGGWWDDFVSGLTNLMLAVPSLVFALAIMAILGPGLMSLVTALGCEELIAPSLEAYESMALRFAREPDLLRDMKQKLARNRDIMPLFDTARFARDLEKAYITMWERARAGMSPASFTVEGRP